VRTIERLLGDPQEFRAEMLELTQEFWRSSFSETWKSMQSSFEASLQNKQRLFESCTVARFFDLLHLRVEIDQRHQNIVPIRGDAKLPIQDVGECLIFPSAFNDKRFWHARVVNDRTEASFPYFDPTISVWPQSAGSDVVPGSGEPELDPALIFKALGNTTRFAIAILLARAPQTSVELARALSLSKPTISHHIHQLREAGLLNERPHKASILLDLNRDTLARLSDISIRALYADAAGLPETASIGDKS
jgi:DNA-binding transcriptional ArsR family regulator